MEVDVLLKLSSVVLESVCVVGTGNKVDGGAMMGSLLREG